ncbi:MAG TPA: nucleotide disphospho-sugar-binding domain-containing protein, partial [Xanthomonadales bacterium]|nr:nucleotide disphospho-sugar-binding domain-containing protein [Xanthomonadales bacterium]
PLTATAERLVELGHEPVFAVRAPALALKHWGDRRFALLAAPLPPGTTRVASDFVTYVDVLWNECGFHDAQRLTSCWAAWRGLIETVAPRLLLVDGAPVAIAACRGLPIVRVASGNAFPNPPAAPWPPFRTWGSVDARHVPAREAAALDHANAAAAFVGSPALATLDDVFEAEERVLTTLPELDLYGERDDVEYVGPAIAVGHAAPPRWPDGSGPRVFAYVKRDHPFRDRLLGALARLADARVALYLDGERPTLPAHVAVHDTLVDVPAALAQCDAVVSAGGANVAGAALLAGKPQLVTPIHAEQYNTGLALQRAGAGLAVTPPFDRPDYLAPLKRLLAEPAFRTAAERVAARHAGTLDVAGGAARLAERCHAALGRRETRPA